MSYTNQANIEDFVKRSLTQSEIDLLIIMLPAIDSWINDQIGSAFAESTLPSVRYYDGGTAILEIDPCTDITKVAEVDEEETDIFIYDLNEEYEPRPRNQNLKKWIELRAGCFPYGVANIAVTATFSSGTVPADIVYLSTFLASQMFSIAFQGQLKSESIEGYSRTFKEIAENNSFVNMTLNKYLKDEVLI